jgi:hypothetical protein
MTPAQVDETFNPETRADRASAGAARSGPRIAEACDRTAPEPLESLA